MRQVAASKATHTEGKGYSPSTGELDEIINIEDKELEIARMNPWGGSSAIIASDGLFSFGANL